MMEDGALRSHMWFSRSWRFSSVAITLSSFCSHGLEDPT